MTRVIITLFLFISSLAAQISNPSVVLPGDTPTGIGGACSSPNLFYANLSNGVLASCVAGTWHAFGTGSGGASIAPTTLLIKGDGGGNGVAASSTDVILLFTSCSGIQYLGADGACHDAGSGSATIAHTTLLIKGDNAGNGIAAAAADVVALFTGCSGTQYLGADGACHSGSAGTVTSVGLVGTANQLTVTGTSPITTSGSFTISIPSVLTLPGTVNKITLTAPTTAWTIQPAADNQTTIIPTGTLCSTTSCLATAVTTTKGDLWGFSTVSARVPVGANGTFLMADSTASVGVSYQTIGPQVHVITFAIDGGGSTITIGDIGYYPSSETACTIDRVDIAADQTGSITVDVWKRAGAIPSSSNLISAGSPVTLSSAQLHQASSISGWTTSVSAGDVFGFSVATVSTVTKVVGQIYCTGPTVGGGGAGTGTVTSVAQSFTGGLISVAGSPITTNGTLALTVAGTSGGIPYFSSASTWASSAALTIHGVVIGGGAGGAPTSTAAGTSGNVLTSNGSSADPTFQAIAACSTCVTAASTLTSTALMTGAGSRGSQTPSATSTLDASGNLSIPGDFVAVGTVTSGSGSGVAGVLDITQGTLPGSFPANSFSLYAPTSISTSYQWRLPAADAAGAIISSGAGTPGVLSIQTVASANTASAIVARDGSGNFIAGTITANLTGTASAATLAASATALATPRAIYGNNFDGTAALTQIIASTFGGTGNGFTKFSGPTTSEKTFTLPNASAVILTDNAAVTVAQGGTGQTSYTDGQLLIGNSSGNTLTKATLTAGANVTITNGNGSITIASSGGGGSGCTTSGSATSVLTDDGTGGCTSNPLFTYASGGAILGSDNATAGTLRVANGSANAHTFWGSGATITNTIQGFASVPTTGHLLDCTVTSTTCLLHDSALVTANVTLAVSPGAGIAHFAGSTQTMTSSTIATGDVAANAITSAKMAVVNTRRTSCFPIGANNGPVLADADLGPQSRQYFINANMTLVEMEVAADGGTPNIILGRSRAGSIVNVVSSALATASSGGIACSNTGGTTGLDGTTTCSSTLQNTGFNIGDWITLVSGTAGGTAKEITACLTFTLD